VLAHRLGVHVLTLGDGVQDVALGEDARAEALGIDDDRRPDVAAVHLLGRLPQRMAGSDGQDHLAHRVAHLHSRTTRPACLQRLPQAYRKRRKA
jgi:hypothetical protein